MDKNVNNDAIERYLNNEMTGAEKNEFESQLNQNEELRNSFEDQSVAHEAIELLIENNLRKQLIALADKEALEENEGKVVSLKRRKNYRQWLSIAAGIVLLVGAFSIFNNDPSRSALIDDYYVPPSFNVARGNVPTEFEQLQEGLKFLRDNKQDEAIQIFNQIPENGAYYITARYYMAHGMYLKEQYKEAYQNFLIVSKSGDVRYAENADWFGLLSCLQNESDNCVEAFRRIESDPDHSYKIKTEELKNRL